MLLYVCLGFCTFIYQMYRCLYNSSRYRININLCRNNCSFIFKTPNINLVFVKYMYIHSSVSTYFFTPECQSGYYGNDCSNQCSINCDVARTCNRFTGQCNEGCKQGWSGDTCDQSKCFTILLKRIKLP